MSTAKQEILEASANLFYAEGFNNTGMEKITSVTGFSKPAVYYHFKSKNILGLAYLEFKEQQLKDFLTEIRNRADSFERYLRLWAKSYVAMAKAKKFFGCPFSIFASELAGVDKPFFEARLRAIEKAWLDFQETTAKHFSVAPAAAAKQARRLLIAHTGCTMLFRLTGNYRYLSDMESEFIEIAASHS